MKTPEDEINDLKMKNSELVLKVQYWKVTAAQRENEKLELMKELNDLRLKLARIRSGGAAQARKLDSALQSSSEEALKHLVHASSAVARTIELAKTYMRDRQDLEDTSPRWSNISGTPNKERVHRVPPMNVGGQSIQPVVALSRAILNTSNPRAPPRSPNPNRSISALPMHMLQDVYIPLTRIDANELAGNNTENTEDNNMDDSMELEDVSLESQNITEEEFDAESSRRLDALIEYLEPEEEIPPPSSRIDNPLEGPSWLLDVPPTTTKPKTPEPSSSLEPDSTTKLESIAATPTAQRNDEPEKENAPVCEFSPTVRRRRRPSPPPASPACRPLAARRSSNSGRVLKVMVAKMRLDAEVEETEGASPSKRVARGTPPSSRKSIMTFDAPSPNGATDAGVIVCETVTQHEVCNRDVVVGADVDNDVDTHGDSRSVTSHASRDSRDIRASRDSDSRASRDSDSGAERAREPRPRRPRKAVTYKEKPLNRKMRR